MKKKKSSPKKAAKKKTPAKPYGNHKPRGKKKSIDWDDLDPDDIRNWDRSEFGDSF